MTAVLSALGAGVSAQQILRFLGTQSPSIANKIQSMLAAGLSAEKVVNFFTNKENFQQLKQELSKNMMNPAQAENPLVLGQHIRDNARGQDLSSTVTNNLASAAKTGVALGATALGSYALSRALPAIAGQFGAGSVPPVSPTPNTPPGGTPPGGLGTNNLPPQDPAPGLPPVPGSPGPGGPGGQPQTGQPPAPGMPGPSPNAQKHVDIIKQLGLEQHIQRQGHMTPQDIAATVEHLTSPGQKKWIAEQTSAPIEQVVSDYLASVGGQQQVTPPVQQSNQVSPEQSPPVVAGSQQTPVPQSVTPQATAEIPEEIKKGVSSLSGKNIGSIVSVGGLPGRIENIKKDIAKVNVDGKIRHLKLKDVEEAPGDVQEAVIQMLQIPERDRSAITAYFGYNPEDKSLAVQYHNGNLYTYDNVDEDKIHKMANKLGLPITTGKNVFGEWEQGKQDSLGAALIAEIIKDPTYSKENKNKTWRKYETGYDYWEKLRKKPKPRVPSSKPKAERASKKPNDGEEHGVKRKKKPEATR